MLKKYTHANSTKKMASKKIRVPVVDAEPLYGVPNSTRAPTEKKDDDSVMIYINSSRAICRVKHGWSDFNNIFIIKAKWISKYVAREIKDSNAIN